MERFILSLDQGTTSSRAILFDHEGRIRAMVQEEFTQYYPKPGWVEHDPRDIWRCQLKTGRLAIEQLGIRAEQIAAVGVTNQRETTIVWEKESGQPVYPAHSARRSRPAHPPCARTPSARSSRQPLPAS